MKRPPSPAQIARERSGLTVAQVARFLRTSPAALQRRERAGRGWSDVWAVKLARLYSCSIDAFPPAGKVRRLSPSTLKAMRGRG